VGYFEANRQTDSSSLVFVMRLESAEELEDSLVMTWIDANAVIPDEGRQV
jgi:hypothetical protein